VVACSHEIFGNHILNMNILINWSFSRNLSCKPSPYNSLNMLAFLWSAMENGLRFIEFCMYYLHLITWYVFGWLLLIYKFTSS
jgi:hypothetical protein